MGVQRPISFISELTAEYFLVPAVVRATSDQRTRALPFHFSMTREGSRAGIGTGAGAGARMAAFYARRPKVRCSGDDVVEVKFNSSLFEAARNGYSLGIPVFAGVPIETSFFNLCDNSPRLWFRLSPEGAIGLDFVCQCSPSGPVSPFAGDEFVTMVPEQALLHLVQHEAMLEEWPVWDERLRSFKRQLQKSRWLFGYRPFFVALMEDDG